MGYYVEYDIQAVVDLSKKDEILQAINALHTPEALAANGARGGSWANGECVDRRYSWVNNPGPQGFPDIFVAFQEWNFPLDNDGNFYWEGSKIGNEDVFFTAIAPWTTGDIYARGEDDYEWGYRFKGGELIELKCEKTWIEA